MLAMKRLDHRGSRYLQNLTSAHRRRGPHSSNLARQRALAKKVSFAQYRDRRLPAGLGQNCQSHLTFLYIEDGVGFVTLAEDRLLARYFQNLSPFADGCKEGGWIKLSELFSSGNSRHDWYSLGILGRFPNHAFIRRVLLPLLEQ
jgi:hypothetical protein